MYIVVLLCVGCLCLCTNGGVRYVSVHARLVGMHRCVHILHMLPVHAWALYPTLSSPACSFTVTVIVFSEAVLLAQLEAFQKG